MITVTKNMQLFQNLKPRKCLICKMLHYLVRGVFTIFLSLKNINHKVLQQTVIFFKFNNKI